MSIDCLVENATVLANYKNKIDGLSLLNNVKDNSIATAFFDPQYRGGLINSIYVKEYQTGSRIQT